MLKAVLTLIAMLPLASTISAQKPLVFGTWSVEYKKCQASSWKPNGQITFLADGKVAGGADSNWWRLRGSSVRAFSPPYMDLRVTIRGSRMTGTADMGMNRSDTFCVRLKRL